jgi:hypothetical protein
VNQQKEIWKRHFLISREKLDSLQRPMPFAKDLQEGPLFSNKKPETHFLLHFTRLPFGPHIPFVAVVASFSATRTNDTRATTRATAATELPLSG